MSPSLPLMRLEIELEQDATAELIRRAVQERRPVDWQAEVLLRRALGLASPSEDDIPLRAFFLEKPKEADA
jgi:hypothetical protein